MNYLLNHNGYFWARRHVKWELLPPLWNLSVAPCHSWAGLARPFVDHLLPSPNSGFISLPSLGLSSIISYKPSVLLSSESLCSFLSPGMPGVPRLLQLSVILLHRLQDWSDIIRAIEKFGASGERVYWIPSGKPFTGFKFCPEAKLAHGVECGHPAALILEPLSHHTLISGLPVQPPQRALWTLWTPSGCGLLLTYLRDPWSFTKSLCLMRVSEWMSE